MKKVLALDIDGTLTDSRKNITPNTLAALHKAMDKGCNVVLASGRPTPGLNRYKNELELDKRGGFLLSFNGARLTECKSGKEIYSNTIKPELVAKLRAFIEGKDVGMMTYEDEGIVTDTRIDEYMVWEAKINGLNIKTVSSFKSYVTFPVNKCLMTAPDAEAFKLMNELIEEFGDELSIYRSEPFFVEIMPKNVDKAATLGILCEYMGIACKDLVACGDGYNDISMIEYAGLGVAMGNANADVKAVADIITKTNDEDGLVSVASLVIEG